MKYRLSAVLFAVPLTLIVSGCATTPKSLSLEQSTAIKKIVVVTEVKEKEWIVLDHTKVWSTYKTYTYGQLGAIGGLIDVAILATEQHIKQNRSLGGDVDTLRKEVPSLEIRDMIDADLRKRLGAKHEVVAAITTDRDRQRGNEPVASVTEGADAVLKLNIQYGIAVYADKKANAAIDADIEVCDGRSGNVLMKKRVQSDMLHHDHHVVQEFAADSGRLFKEGIAKAVEALCEQVDWELSLE
jgi:hypothetical protein